MNIQIGAQIKRLRLAKGLTQEAVAAEVGVSYQAVSKWETGATTPDIALLPALASLFGVRIDDMFRVDHTDELERLDRILYHDCLTEENFAYAKRILDGLLNEEPQNAELCKRYAELILKRNHRDERAARKKLEAVMADSCRDDELFVLYRRLCPGERETARSGNEEFLRACKSFGNNQKLAEQLIKAMLDIGDYEQAQRQLERIESSSLRSIFRGELALAMGDRAAAVAAWRSIPEDDHKGQYEAGERLNALGAYEEAIRCYRNSFASAKPPRDLSAVYALAFLYGKLGRKEEAAEAWELILRVLAEEHGVIDGQTVAWARQELCALRTK